MLPIYVKVRRDIWETAVENHLEQITKTISIERDKLTQQVDVEVEKANSGWFYRFLTYGAIGKVTKTDVRKWLVRLPLGPGDQMDALRQQHSTWTKRAFTAANCYALYISLDEFSVLGLKHTID